MPESKYVDTYGRIALGLSNLFLQSVEKDREIEYLKEIIRGNQTMIAKLIDDKQKLTAERDVLQAEVARLVEIGDTCTKREQMLREENTRLLNVISSLTV